MHDHTVPTYEALALDLKNLGIDCVFGLMSDDTALLISAIDSLGIRFHGARHENTSVAMAEGYSAATGRVGIAILGRGPATANAIHGATYAHKSGSRVLLVLGDAPNAPVSRNGLGPDTKGFNSLLVLQGIGYRTVVANDSATSRQALATAYSAAHHGAAALLFPSNILREEIDLQITQPTVRSITYPPAIPARTAAVQAAATLLQNSRKPLFIAGLGAHRSGARDELIHLAEHVGAALATTMKAKDMFRGHPFDCGVVGSFSHAGGRRLIEQADCVVVFGASLNQRTTSYGNAIPANVPLIQIDNVRSHIGRWFHCDISLVSDVKEAALQLLNAVPERPDADKPLHSDEFRRWLADFDLADDFQPAHTPRTLDPRSLGIELDRLLPAHRNVVYDAGNFLSIAPYLSVPGPAHIKQASDFSSIGMGFGTALGFARGMLDTTTVLLMGDGGFLMTMGELETVAREEIPLVIVLMNDCAYGAELHFLKLRNMPVSTSQFPDIDYAPIAQAFGFEAATIRTLDDLQEVAPLLKKPGSTPVFLDCKINGAVAAPFLMEGLAQETAFNKK